MAKRSLPAATAPSAAKATAPSSAEQSTSCFSRTNDGESLRHMEQQVRLSSEESTHSVDAPAAKEAASTMVQAEPLEWPFLCPFCCTAKLTDPVDLHDSAYVEEKEKEVSEGAPRHCLACRCCAERWCAAVSALNDAAATPQPPTSSKDETFVRSTRTSVSPPSYLMCPLCDRNVPADATGRHDFVSLSDEAQRENALKLLRHPERVSNSFTGIASQASPARGGQTSAEASQPLSRAPTLFCGVCEEQKATCMCVQCDFGLCDACHKATHSKGKFKQHEVVGLDQARRRDQQKCREHAGMALDLYCETCETCVCVTCCFGGAHRGHDVFPLADVARRTAEALKGEAHHFIATSDRATAARNDLAELLPRYNAKVSAVETDITRCFSSLRRILQTREDALLTQLRTASAEVTAKSARLQTAAGALADLLTATSTRLTSFDQTVSPATLMRVAAHVQARQAWTLRAATRLTEEAAAAVDGWRYQLGEESVNGCRMACFDMLNAQTPNEKGIVQYQQVLGDLGRLDVFAELQPPTVRASGEENEELVDENGELDGEDNTVNESNDTPHDVGLYDGDNEESFAKLEKSVMDPIVELQPESPTPSQKRRDARSASPTSTAASSSVVCGRRQEAVVRRPAVAALEDDVPRLRPSHVSENTAAQQQQVVASSSSSSSVRASEAAAADRATEMHLTSGTVAYQSISGRDSRSSNSSALSFSRVAALRSVTSSRTSLPRSLAIGGNSTREENSFAISTTTTSRTTSQVRAALEALERRDTTSAHPSSSLPLSSLSNADVYPQHPKTNALRLRCEDAGQLARDTVPFRVSMPQKRVLSLDRGDENQRYETNSNNSNKENTCPPANYSSVSWRALKVQRSSAAQDTAASDVATRMSSWQPSGSTRLSFFSDFEVSKPSKSNGVSPVRELHGDLTSGNSVEEHRETLKRKTTGLQLEL